MNSPELAATPCQMYCTNPIGPHGHPAADDWKASCLPCEAKLTWLCSDVLPSIRRQGYWVPSGSTAEAELAAIIGQAGLRSAMNDLLAAFGIGGAA